MENRKCVICYQDPDQENKDKTNLGLYQKRQSSTTKTGKDALFRKQLSTIFLLRKFFEMPQDICIRLLEEHGNPCDWIWWCPSCSVLVDKAKCVFDQIAALEKQFEALKLDLKTAVLSSKSSLPETRVQNESDWGPTEIVRECFENTLKKTGCNDDLTDQNNTKVDIKEEKIEMEEDFKVLSSDDGFSMFSGDENEESINSVSTNENGERDLLDLESADDLLIESETNSIASIRSKRNNRKYSVKDNCDYSNFSEQVNLSDPEKKLHSGLRLRNNSRKHGKKSEIFFCKDCVRYYSNKYSLKAHINMFHGGKFPITCESCEAGFVTEEDLKSHNEKRHVGSSMYKFLCTKCPRKAFRLEIYLRRHCKREHPEDFQETFSPEPAGNRIEESNVEKKPPDCPDSGNDQVFVTCDETREVALCGTPSKEINHKQWKNSSEQNSARPDNVNISNDSCEEDNISEMNESRELGKSSEQLEYGRSTRKFKCQMCPRSFRRIISLKEHFVNFHGDLPLKCSKCALEIVNEEELKVHNEIHHKERWKVPCSHCVKKFLNKYALREHYRKSHPTAFMKKYPNRYRSAADDADAKESVSCPECHKKVFDLKYHCKCMHPGYYEEKYKNLDNSFCDNCGTKFASVFQAKSHFRTEHPEEFRLRFFEKKKSKTCPYCPYKTQSKKFMEDHINIHNNARPYVCDLCGADFKNAQTFRNHQHSKHYEELGLQPYKCTECGKMFNTPAYLKIHMKAHKGEFSYHCHLCNKGFAAPSFLKTHLLRHEGEKPHLCDQCGNSFITHTQLQLHIRTVHLKEKNFQCKLCPKKFSCSSRLKRHVQGVHSDGTKPYQCKICQKQFPVRNYLYIHMRSHAKKGIVAPVD